MRKQDSERGESVLDPLVTTRTWLVAVAALVALTTAGAASAQPAPVVVRDARIAADGLSVTYTLTPPGRVMVIPIGGGDPRPATPAETAAYTPPRPQPTGDEPVGNGQRSLTVSNGRETWIDLLTPATGAQVTVLPPGIITIIGAPSWSADGTRFVVVGENSEHGPEVYAGSLPLAISRRPDYVGGAAPPQVRRITFSNPQ